MTRKQNLTTVNRPDRGNRDAVAAVLAALRDDVTLEPHDEALGRLALTLAETLDDGAGMATAAVSKELRSTLAALTAKAPKGDTDDDIFGNDVPATIRDTKKS